MYTVSVNLAGYDGVFYYFGEGQITNYDGTVLVQGQRNPYEIVTGEIHPELADQPERNGALKIIFIISVIVVMLQSQAENLTVA